MELPRDDMELELAGAEVQPVETWHDGHESHDEHAEVEQLHEFFDGDEATAFRPAKAASPWSTPGTVRLTTAAAMANGGKAVPAAPDAFRQGMLVLHPGYGLGQIVALSGSGAGRKATIDFPPPAGRKKIVLADGSLQPVAETSV
jgi:DNA helicase II / ATP-dependent DNA helicase PcrA